MWLIGGGDGGGVAATTRVWGGEEMGRKGKGKGKEEYIWFEGNDEIL